MDTKSTKLKRIASFCCILLSIALFSITATTGGLLRGTELHNGNFYATEYFRSQLYGYVSTLADCVWTQDELMLRQLEKSLAGVTEIYFNCRNNTTGYQIKNTNTADPETMYTVYRSQSVYPVGLYYTREGYQVIYDGMEYNGLPAYEATELLFGDYYALSNEYSDSDTDIEITVFVPDASTLSADGPLGEGYQRWKWARRYYSYWIALFGSAFLMLAAAFLMRRSLHAAHRWVAHHLAKVPAEIGVVGFILSLYINSQLVVRFHDFSSLLMGVLVGIFSAWWVYGFLVALFFAPRDLAHNSYFYRLGQKLNAIMGIQSSYQAKLASRFLVFVLVEVVCVIGFVLLVIMGLASDIKLLLYSLFFAFIGLVALAIYYFRVRRVGQDLDSVMDQIDLLRTGDMSSPLELPKNSDLRRLADNLNSIRDGLRQLVEEQTVSEKNKLALITNVSHDLKTPLTSIINYIDLLKIPDLSEAERKEYLSILDTKAHRLSTLVEDLFTVSKASSGALKANIEVLDLAGLLNQTLGEQVDLLEEAPLDFKVTIPPGKQWVLGDGGMMYRVFENLIGNIIKYSQKGTRVYIDIVPKEASVQAVFRNISAYEMNFTPQDIVGRFFRGDASRSTPGSGLGLSIAQSFMSIQGGFLDITLDGDLFKATVSLPKAPQQEEPAQQLQPPEGSRPQPETPAAEPQA